MAYDQSRPGRDNESTDASGQRFLGEPGFRTESELRGSGAHHRVRTAGTNLGDVFDDPTHGAVGRDRLGVHFAWESVLALAVLGLGVLLYRNHHDLVSGEPLRQLLVFGAALGALTQGAAITLRVGAPNLAIGPAAAAAALFYAERSGQGVVPVTMITVAIALGFGAAIAVLVVGFHVPAWAGSLVGATVAIVWIQKHSDPVKVVGEYDLGRHVYYLVGGFVALTIIAGLLGAIRSIRRGIGRFRPVGDPAERRGGFAGFMATLGLISSTGLAAVAGVLLAAGYGAQDRSVAPTLGLELTGLALGAALVGGVSAYGRRGGVFGTLLGVALLTLLIWYAQAEGWRISFYALAAGAVATGLVVTRLVETFGRPLPLYGDPEDWTDVGVAGTAGVWSSGSGDTWSNLPAQPAPHRTDQWGEDDRWSAIR